MAAALEPSLRNRLLEAFNEVVAELNAAGGPGQLEIRLAGDDVSFVWSASADEAVEPPADLNARVALRLPDFAKSKIEEHATSEGVSVNAWIVRSLQLALERSSAAVATKSGRHLRGTGKS
jgi:predicted HicB family RNase H-like nuclease